MPRPHGAAKDGQALGTETSRKRKQDGDNEVQPVRRRSERLKSSPTDAERVIGKMTIGTAAEGQPVAKGAASRARNDVLSAQKAKAKPKKTTNRGSNREKGEPHGAASHDKEATTQLGSEEQLAKKRVRESAKTKDDVVTEQEKNVTGKTNLASGEPTDALDERPKYWLMKAEPETRIEKGKDVKFSIDDLKDCIEPEPWTGVRNYVARNNMQSMKKGELAFFYHSNIKVPGIAGICKIVEEATVDDSAFDPEDPYFDPKSNPEKPRWFCVKVSFIRKFPALVPLSVLQSHAKDGGPLAKMEAAVLRRAPSVSKVSADQWEFVMSLVPDPSS